MSSAVLTDPAQLPAPVREAWDQLLQIVTQRGFDTAIEIPAAPASTLHAAFWQTSDGILKSAPEFLPNRIIRGTVLRNTHRYPEAEAEARAALALDPCSNRVHRLLKEVLALRAAVAEGEALHLSARGECPDLAPYHDAALYLAGDLRHHYPHEAIAAFQQHLTSYPQDGLVAHALIDLLIEMDDFAAAEVICRARLAIADEDALAHQRLGALLAEKGEIETVEEGLIHFERAMALDPSEGRSRLLAAQAREELGDLEGALDLLRIGAEENTGNIDYNIEHGDLAIALGYEEEGTNAYIRALAAEPDEADLVEELEQHLHTLGVWTDDNVTLQYLLAERALNEGEPLRAIKHLSALRQAGITTRELFLRMAEAHHGMGLVDDPLSFLLMAKQQKRRSYDTHGVVDPSDARLELLTIALSIPPEVISIAEARKRLEPFCDFKKMESEPEGFFMVLADALQQVGEREKALAALAEAIRQSPLDLSPWIELAGALTEENRPAEAARAWEWVWVHGGRAAPVADHLAALYRAAGHGKWGDYYATESARLHEMGEEEDAIAEEEAAATD